jgi:hypothetical protein
MNILEYKREEMDFLECNVTCKGRKKKGKAYVKLNLYFNFYFFLNINKLLVFG